MKPIMDYFKVVKPSSKVDSEAKTTSSKASKSPEKRKYENSSTTSKQQESFADEMITKLLDNYDEDLEANLEAIKKKASDVSNGKPNVLSEEKDYKSKENEKSREFMKIAKEESSTQNKFVENHKSESNYKNMMDQQNQTNVAPKKRLSLWDLPAYKESTKSNKSNKDVEHADTKFMERDEENAAENKTRELSLKNDNIDDSISQSKLPTTSKNPSSTKKIGQRKISDFFLSNL